jgi:DNA end-binding protein Ku
MGMPRPVWNGTISFGLVSIPVKLFHAVSKKNVSFNQLDDRTMSRIKLRRVSADTGEEVPDEHIVKGYEFTKGQYVIVDPDDLEPFMPVATKTIDLDEFVDLDEIDPVYFDSAYYVAPEKAPKPYVLLARAMEQAGKVAIGRFVMRQKQYIAAIRPVDGRLMLSTMVFADELVDVDSIDELQGIDEVEASSKEIAMAESLVESLTADFEPEKYRDEYREQVLELIDKKAAGEEFEAPVAEKAAPQVVDLMAALEASVKAAKEARKRHPSGEPEKKTRTSRSKAASASASSDDSADEVEDNVTAISAKPRSRTRKSA